MMLRTNASPAHPLIPLLLPDAGGSEIRRALGVVRRHLSMDVAFLARFRETDRILEYADMASGSPLHEGQAIPLSQGYCQKVVSGELPQFIADTSKVPATQAIEATRTVPIGAHLSVPVLLEGGTVYGTLCCFSYVPNTGLNEADLHIMRALAEILALRLDDLQSTELTRRGLIDEVQQAMRQGAPRIVYQPVFELENQALHGFECLSRFDVQPSLPPDQWFHKAHLCGMGAQLELHALLKAARSVALFSPGTILNLNTSPELIVAGQLQQLLDERVDVSRLTLEITEHAMVDDYQALADALQPLRSLGCKLAVDDAGAGYASMRHILNLNADIVKLDISLTQRIHMDRNRRALARGLISFAREVDSKIVAEGVESAEELAVLRDLGVDYAQGYHLGRPMDRDQALSLALRQ